MVAAIEELRPQIRYWAARFERAGARGIVDAEDLERAAEVALWKARPRFNPAAGSWKAFAGLRAVGAMKDELRLTDHLSRTARRRAVSGEVPAAELLSMDAEQLGTRPRDLVDRRASTPAEIAAAADLWAWVGVVLGARRLAVIEGYFRGGETLLEIAFRLQLSESRVCQLLAQSLRMLRRRRKRGLGEER